MIKYYRGHIKNHAEFWASFRELAPGKHFDAFVSFFKEVKRDVEEGKCTLRGAGYALKPAFYDDEIYAPREPELTFAQDAVEDLIAVAETDPDEAERLWAVIVETMDPYL
jgi:hypothetical protein